MTRGYLLIDGNNIAYASCAAKKLKVGTMETQAIYHFVRAIRNVIAAYCVFQPIVLWDGISWRKDFFAEYKGNRDKPPETKSEILMAELRASLRQQKPYIIKALENLGVPQMVAMNLEADDLAGIITRRAEKDGKQVLMISGDTDWIQLVSKRCAWFDVIGARRVTMKTIKEKLGVETPRAWLEVKAISGDKTDDIPGVGGIGKPGAIDLINKYGSAASFLNQCMDGTIKPGELHKKYAEFGTSGEKQGAFIRNMKLMDLRSPDIPAPLGLKMTKGKLDHEQFRDLCMELRFNTMLADLEGWCEPFEKIAA